MRKILLVIDSYSDLVQLESLLKKLGLDTVGMQTTVSLSERMLSFSPDAVIMSGRGAKVNGVEISQKIKKRKGVPKIVLLYPAGHEPDALDLKAEMDLLLNLPLDPFRFLQQLCDLLGLPAEPYLDKLSKLAGSESMTGEETLFVKDSPLGGVPAERPSRYQAAAAAIVLPHPATRGLDGKLIQDTIREDRRRRDPADNSNQALENWDEKRRELVRALFRRG